MIDKKTYHSLKKEIKSLCRKNVSNMADDMGLNEFEKGILLDFYDDKTSVYVCMKYGMNKNTYTNHLKMVINKIYNYKNTQ